MPENKWCYSLNEEDFHGVCDTKQEAIAEALELCEEEEEQGKYIWIGRCVPVILTADSDSVLEQLSEQATGQVGEIAYNYLDDVTKEHEQILDERLTSVIQEWMKEFQYEPNFWSVTDIEKVRAV